MIQLLINYQKSSDLEDFNLSDEFLNKVLRKAIKKQLKIDLK